MYITQELLAYMVGEQEAVPYAPVEHPMTHEKSGSESESESGIKPCVHSIFDADCDSDPDPDPEQLWLPFYFRNSPSCAGAHPMTHENSSRLSQLARDFTDLLATDYTDYTEFNQ